MRVAIRIVRELVNDANLSCAAKSVYTVALMEQPKSIQALAARMGMDPRSVVSSCRQLAARGWMQLISEGRSLRPAATVPRDVEAVLAKETHELINLAPYGGEENTWRFIDWIVAPHIHFVRNARPPFLKTPKTGSRLEYDILAPYLRWATEYHGDQHFGPTPFFPGEKEFIQRHQRDLLKASLSRQNGITLSIATKSDLTLEGILAIIPNHVPRRAFDPKGPYIQMLERVGNAIVGGKDWDRD